MYDFKKVEKEIAAFWAKEKIYEKLKENNIKGEPFYFCDGPPYATGMIHPGTAWNKTIKDAFCRYMRMRGFNVRAQPGYDTHGLPIEVKVEQNLEVKNKAEIEKRIGIEKFIRKCRDFATKYIDVMGSQFSSLGIWMDFDAPYITYRDSYIEASWKTLKSAHDQGLMHEGVYVLPYCYRCETTIANYELEYSDETDPSLYVKFKAESEKTKEKEYLIIWTTTPWTLVANMAVMVHPTLAYVKVKVDDEIWIVAKARLEHVLELAGKSGTVLEEMSGKKLEGKKYAHPFQNKIEKQYARRVVLSDEYVTVEDGSGLVHCAPGHGPEDFIIGKRFDIEAFCPVDEHGNYTKEAGEYAGKNVRAASAEIIKMLSDDGMLVHEARIRHRYPHCWRCKTQLIFLATKQWFITISKLKEKMHAEIENTVWKPEFAKERFKEFVNNAPDWCISRQRYWGIPLPIWRCTKCAKIHVVGSRKELGEVKELHRPYIDEVELLCECGEKMKRVTDVLDVWFDSGNAVWASLEGDDEKTYSHRADLIIEGQDQIRGWFYSLLGSGVVKYGQCPYKSVLMHGFFVDEKGEKMSKSVGNFVPLETILEKYGADSFRLWGMGSTIWEELKFNWNDMKEANADLNTLLNMVMFLERFYPNKKLAEKQPYAAEDFWLQSKTQAAIKAYRTAFEGYEPNKAANAAREFAISEVSRFYMKIAKDRIAKEDNSQAALNSIYHGVLTSLKLLAPFTPYACEHLYQRFFKKYEKTDSIHLFRIENEDDAKINVAMEKEMEAIKEITASALNARQEAKIKVRWPMRTLYVETKSHEVKEALNNFGGVVCRLANVKGIKAIDEAPHGELASSTFADGKTHVDKAVDEELYGEGVANEIKRRIQSMRKEKQLLEKDEIEVLISGDKEIIAIAQKNKARLMKEVNASKISQHESKAAEEFEIDGRNVKIAIEKG